MKSNNGLPAWFVFAACVVLLQSSTAFADLIEGNYAYTTNALGQATITDFNAAYSGNLDIPPTLGGHPVIGIGVAAFANCPNLTGVTMPASVTNIGNNAFYNCTGLVGVTLGNGVTRLGSAAFAICYRLAGITIPAGVKSIGDGAFYKCSGLAYAVISNGVSSIGSSAFYSCNGLNDLTVPASVTNIGTMAFSCCNGLTNAIIGSGVTSIGAAAFSSCTSLAGVTIGSGVITIGDAAFSSCTSLTRVTIPDKVVTIGVQAFNMCSGLTNAVIGSGVTSMGNYAFYMCTALTGVAIGSGVTNIGSYAFYACNSLAGVTIPDGVVSIGNYAFCGCSSLAGVTIGSGVASIGSYAFYNCGRLAGVTIPGSVTRMGDYVFGWCTRMTGANLKPGVPYIGNGMFSYCYDLANVTIPASVTNIGNEAFNACRSLPSVSFGSGLISIGNSAFYNCYGLTALSIPNGVISIASDAFSYCTALAGVTIGKGLANLENRAFLGCYSLTAFNVDESNSSFSSLDGVLFNATRTALVQYPGGRAGNYVIPGGVASIGYGAFNKCVGLSGVTIPSGVVSIGDYAFYGCGGLTSATIPATVASIGYEAFAYCTSLTAINVDAANSSFSSLNGVLFNAPNRTTLIQYPAGQSGSYAVPNGVTNIGPYAFYQCAGLTGVTLPVSVTSIGVSAFQGCTGLSVMTLPGSVTRIGDSAFYGCSGLAGVTIGGGVTSIGSYAYYNCSSLSGLTIPGSVTSLGASAFSGCVGLTVVTVPGSVTNWGGNVFSGCTSLVSVTLGAGLSTIGDGAFSSCKSLGGVTIPGSVSTIGNYAFNGCLGLTSVTIPASVTVIGFSAFGECAGLTGVFIGRGVTSIGQYAFERCTALTAITVDAANLTYSSLDGVVFNTNRTALILCPAGKSGYYAIPAGVISIKNGAFYSCGGLTGIEIPTGVSTIESHAFYKCTSLSGITIPASVVNFGDYTFGFCGLLSGIFFMGHAPNNYGANLFYQSLSVVVYHQPATMGWGPTFAGRPTALSSLARQVTFSAQGGSVSPTNKYVTLGGVYGALPEPVRAGFAFKGWWTAAGGAGVSVTEGSVVTAAGAHTLYAAWGVAPTFAEALDTAGLEWTTGGDALWETQFAVSHDGQDAAQSGSVGDLKTSWIQTTVTMPGVVGFWWKVSSEASFDYLSFLIDGVVQERISGESGWLCQSVVVSPGQHTLRWAYSKDGSLSKGADRGWLDQITWTLISVTVSFDARGGEVGQTSKVVTVGMPYGTLSEPSRTGYTFTGWAIATNGIVVDADTVVTVASDHTLAATWRANDYTVAFDPRGGAVDPTNTVVLFGAPYGPLPEPVRTGHTFTGWLATTNGVAFGVESNTVVTVASDHTLSATWRVNDYTVVFDPRGGAVSPPSKVVAYGSVYGALPMPSAPDAVRVGYTFGGWYTNTAFTGAEVTVTTVMSLASDHALYASWLRDDYLCEPEADATLVSAGSYDGYFYCENAFSTGTASAVRGTLTMKITDAAKGGLTAKAVVQQGTFSFSGKVWSAPDDVNGTKRTTLATRTGETLDLYVRQDRVWGTLKGGKVGEELALDGARNRFSNSKDAEALALLNGYKGYYTVGLPPADKLSLGEAEAAPEGIGYLAVTVGSGGSAKVAGVLADGTSVSMSGRLLLFGDCYPWVCVPFFVTLYTRKGWVGGLLWIDPDTRVVVTDRDMGWFVRWEKPGAGPDGFSELLDACGGYYNTVPVLASHYLFDAEAEQVPYFYTASNSVDWVTNALPEAVGVTVAGVRMTMVKGTAPAKTGGVYTYTGENPSLATLTFTAKTGILKGKFNVYYDYDLQGRMQHKIVSVPYAGLLAPVRAEVFEGLPAGLGHCLVPDTDPSVKLYKIKRSFPVWLGEAP